MKLLVCTDDGDVLDVIEEQGVGDICAAYGLSPHTEQHLLPEVVRVAIEAEEAAPPAPERNADDIGGTPQS